jgi:ferredoxin
MKLLKKSELDKALAALIRNYTVFAPAHKDERLSFTKLGADDIKYVNLSGLPVVSPKDLLLPRSETLFGVGLKTGDVSIPEPAGPAVLFCARPCDVRGFVNLDSVFIGDDYTDTAYEKRRESLAVITLARTEIPSPACFCESMGGGPDSAEGADVFLQETKDGVAWLVSFITEKGAQIEKIWEEAGILSAPGKAKAAPCGDVPLKVEKPADLAKTLKDAFSDPMWARFSEACIGCGVCSFICPTCYCFDIDAETKKDTAEEFRCWDCCLFSDYSRMAGGHDPRPTKKERLRNRYLHKLSYFDERYGKTLCVGCGRCISKCPAGLDITSVIEWGGK